MDRKSTIAVAVKLAGIYSFIRGSVNVVAPLVFNAKSEYFPISESALNANVS
jgi:hypothetical protein